jgi:3-oxoacyl-[acyl-carrier protein] reductase
LTKFGRIDAQLNIAGVVLGIDLFQMTDEQCGMQLKLYGALRITLSVWEALKAARGSVVLIVGNAAEIPTASAAAVGVINAGTALWQRHLPMRVSSIAFRSIVSLPGR